MKLTDDERRAIVEYRIQKAVSTFIEAEGIATLSFWNAVANRLYYACYYITGALLIHNNLEANTHRGIIHMFGQHFIKEGIVTKESGKLYSRLFELRQTGDYDDLFNISEEDVKPLIEKAKQYIDELSELISN